MTATEPARADASWVGAAAVAVAASPRTWGTALRQVVALAEPGWWRRAPRLPLPPAGYLRFRLVTAYGDPDARPAPEDVVTDLGWCREERRRSRRGGSGRSNRRLPVGVGR